MDKYNCPYHNPSLGRDYGQFWEHPRPHRFFPSAMGSDRPQPDICDRWPISFIILPRYKNDMGYLSLTQLFVIDPLTSIF